MYPRKGARKGGNMLERGNAIRLGCVSCWSHDDSEIQEMFLETPKGEAVQLSIVARCVCGHVNIYRFKHVGISSPVPGAMIDRS